MQNLGERMCHFIYTKRKQIEQGKKAATQNLFMKEVDQVEQGIWKGFL